MAKALGNITLRVATLARGAHSRTPASQLVDSPSRRHGLTPPSRLGRIERGANGTPPFDSTISPRDSLVHAWTALVDTVKSLVHRETTAPVDSTR